MTKKKSELYPITEVLVVCILSPGKYTKETSNSVLSTRTGVFKGINPPGGGVTPRVFVRQLRSVRLYKYKYWYQVPVDTNEQALSGSRQNMSPEVRRMFRLTQFSEIH